MDKAKAKEIIEQAGISVDARAEKLKLEDFAKIANLI